MRKFIAFFFLLIFTCQFLPVKAIGKSLLKGQQSEEVKDDCSDTDYSDAEYIYSGGVSLMSGTVSDLAGIFAASDNESLPDNHITDIQCPPPNC